MLRRSAMIYISLNNNLDIPLSRYHRRKLSIKIAVQIVLVIVQLLYCNLIRSAEAYNAFNGANKVDFLIAGDERIILIYNMSTLTQWLYRYSVQHH